MMAADKFGCPKCGLFMTAVTATVHGAREITRYRNCRVCNVNFATTESVKDTPRTRSWLGEEKSNKLWPPAPFQYRKPTPRRGKKWDKSTT